MTTGTNLRHATLAAVALATLALTPGSAQAAGLFDFLFGGFSQPAPQYRMAAPPPLGVRVNPHKRPKFGGSGGGRPVASQERKGKLQASIDPVKNPGWYLDDPTLRRGDIVILKRGAMVYEGGRAPRSTEDFTPVEKSRLVSKGEREKIEKMARKDPSVAMSDPVPTEPKKADAKEASLR